MHIIAPMGTGDMDGRPGNVLPEVPTRAHIRDGVSGHFACGCISPVRCLSVAIDSDEDAVVCQTAIQVRVRFGILLVLNRRIIMVNSCTHGTCDTCCPGNHGVDESADDYGKQQDTGTTYDKDTIAPLVWSLRVLRGKHRLFHLWCKNLHLLVLILA